MNRLLKIQGHFMPLGQAKTVSSTSINNTSASSLAHLSAQEKKFYPHLVISTEVREALLTGKAVVALESTIISHGMPYPQNLETALAVEQVARDNGAIPATIAILKGKLHVGLEREDLETLAKLGHECRKCSRRDLASVIAEKANGATTVAATMYIANMAGIKVFVTGGIGGVHRGVQDTMDISADLNELGRTPVAVICAGVKSILDIGRTLEYLETQGVSVVSYGAEEFPAFFTRHSGFKAPHTLNDVGSCARLIAANRDIGMTSGMVFAVPVPEHQEAESKDITKATDQALKEANDRGITGRDITPFLLSRIAELTNNRSLTSNIALVKNNCKVGSQIAVQLSAVTKAAKTNSSSTSPSSPPRDYRLGNKPVTIIGGINMDIVGRPEKGTRLVSETSNIGSVTRNWGGVGRNVAECVARLSSTSRANTNSTNDSSNDHVKNSNGCQSSSHPTVMISAVGRDQQAQNIHQHLRSLHIDPLLIEPSSSSTEVYRTGSYMAMMNENGDLVSAIADTSVCKLIQPQSLPLDVLSSSALVVLDANVPESTVTYTSSHCHTAGVPVWFEPTSVAKSLRGLPAFTNGHIMFLKPSTQELMAMSDAMGYPSSTADESFDALQGRLRFMLSSVNAPSLSSGSSFSSPVHIVLTRGSKGVVLASRSFSSSDANNISVTSFPVPPSQKVAVINTSGAGDSLVGAMVWHLTHRVNKPRTAHGYTHEQVTHSVPYGMSAATLSVQAPEAISTRITAPALDTLVHNC